jgi:outer membrane lipoprotein carrier protein
MYRLALLSCLMFAGCLGAEEPNLAPPGSARERLQQFSDGLETLQARFHQKVISNDGAVQDSSSGQVWLSRPQRFRWEYGGEFPEIVVADGKRIWIYDVTLEQVTVKDQSSAAADSPLTLLTDPNRLDEQFEVREAGDASGLQLLELRARSMEADFERILLGLSDDGLDLMIMEDAFGLRTELRFDEVRRNPALEEALFTFEPPAGVDLIGAAD